MGFMFFDPFDLGSVRLSIVGGSAIITRNFIKLINYLKAQKRWPVTSWKKVCIWPTPCSRVEEGRI